MVVVSCSIAKHKLIKLMWVSVYMATQTKPQEKRKKKNVFSVIVYNVTHISPCCISSSS